MFRMIVMSCHVQKDSRGLCVKRALRDCHPLENSQKDMRTAVFRRF